MLIGVTFFIVWKPPLSSGILLGVLVAVIGTIIYYVTKSKQIAAVIWVAAATLTLGTAAMIILAVISMG